MIVQAEALGAALVDVRTAAKYLGLSPSMLYKLMDSRRLPYVKLGRARRIRVEDLDKLISQSLVVAELA